MTVQHPVDNDRTRVPLCNVRPGMVTKDLCGDTEWIITSCKHYGDVWYLTARSVSGDQSFSGYTNVPLKVAA